MNISNGAFIFIDLMYQIHAFKGKDRFKVFVFKNIEIRGCTKINQNAKCIHRVTINIILCFESVQWTLNSIRFHKNKIKTNDTLYIMFRSQENLTLVFLICFMFSDKNLVGPVFFFICKLQTKTLYGLLFDQNLREC